MPMQMDGKSCGKAEIDDQKKNLNSIYIFYQFDCKNMDPEEEPIKNYDKRQQVANESESEVDKKQKKGRQYVACSEPRPEIDPPNQDHIPKFYKTKNKLELGPLQSSQTNHEFYQYQLGMLVSSYANFQEDFIMHFASILSYQAQFLNVVVHDPNHLYISMTITHEENRRDLTLGEDYMETENNVFFMLDSSREIFADFIRVHLSEQSIFSEENNTDILNKKFQKQVVQKIMKLYESVFSR